MRTLVEIQQEYTMCCAKLGENQFRQFLLLREEHNLENEIFCLNQEAEELKKEQNGKSGESQPQSN